MYMEDITYDTVAFVSLKRDCTNEEVGAWLKSILPWGEARKPRAVDGFCFIKGFKILPPKEAA